MSEKKICNTSTCKSKDKEAKEHHSCSAQPEESSVDNTTKNWESLNNYPQFMEALIKFMNESWVVVSEIREKSGLSSKDKTYVSMTEEERDAKIKEIIGKLQEKYKELSDLENQLGQVSGTENTFPSALGNQTVQPPQGVCIPQCVGPPLARSSPTNATFYQQTDIYAPWTPPGGTDTGYRSAYVSGDSIPTCPPPRRRLQFSPVIRPPPPGETSGVFEPYRDSDIESGGANSDGVYCSESCVTTGSSVASEPASQGYSQYDGTANNSSRQSNVGGISAPSSATSGKRDSYQPQAGRYLASSSFPQSGTTANGGAYLGFTPRVPGSGAGTITRNRASLSRGLRTSAQNYSLPAWTQRFPVRETEQQHNISGAVGRSTPRRYPGVCNNTNCRQ